MLLRTARSLSLLSVVASGFLTTPAALADYGPAPAGGGSSSPVASSPAPTAGVPVPLKPLPAGAMVLQYGQMAAGQLAWDPVGVTVSVSASAGGAVVAGNIGISVPPEALLSIPNSVTVTVEPRPQVPIPGGPAQFSPNGTIARISFSDQAGVPVTSFPTPISLMFRYGAADVGQAHGDASALTVGYFVDAETPPFANPNHYPIGTLVVAPPSDVTSESQYGTVTFNTQAIGSVFAVITNPVGFVQTLQPSTPLMSSFNPATSQVFGARPQFSYLQVVEPQIGVRLMVLDPQTNGYAYVDAGAVGPSGPPPNVSSSGAS